MNITQKQLSNLYKYAQYLLRNKKQFSPEDIVNDILLKSIESDIEFNNDSIKKSIYNSVLNLKLNVRNNDGGLSKDKKFSKFETDRFCKGCKEVLPIAMFYIVTRHGIQEIESKCKVCSNKQKTAIQKKKRQLDEKYRLAYNERMKKYREKNRIKINLISKQSYYKSISLKVA